MDFCINISLEVVEVIDSNKEGIYYISHRVLFIIIKIRSNTVHFVKRVKELKNKGVLHV